ncbi:hypothetical protein [Pseudoalteromonas sp. TB64]|uniref:hypothetical protein n=1 Tax=Pseudoalteromonas sp. TB64 TaxID=1938600 RepID=UPI00041DA17A|nr:hypothetical protein [Pseudoalteromonas sp. TB64]
MVKLIKDEFDDLNIASYFIALVSITLFTAAITWYLFSYELEHILQTLSYPYSGYPVIVYSDGSFGILPVWLILCTIALLSVFRGVYELFKKSWIKKIIHYLLIGLCALLVLATLSSFIHSLIWESAAREHGYIECPMFDTTLVKYAKNVTAWTKEESLCHDYQVGEALSSGNHEDIIETAEYLKNGNK